MGTNIGSLINPSPIKYEDLKGRIVAIDSFNMLYQFITTIRQPDGTPLMDSKGRVTSHLSGLYSRSVNMLSKGVKPIFVFDGKPPELKAAERKRRTDIKEKSQIKYDEAVQKEDVEAMRKYATRTARLTPLMVEESKLLLKSLGLPVIQAPSEGEAQVAKIVQDGNAYAGISQDYDSLLHGNPRVVRNLSNSGKRRRVGGMGYVTISPELIELSKVLNNLGIDRNQLINLSILVGTDYNIGGVFGVGPKKAIALVKKHKSNSDALFKEVGWTDDMTPWQDIFKTISNMPVSDDYEINWNAPDNEKIIKLLCDKHEFSLERIQNGINKINTSTKARAQKGLGEFF